VIGELGTNLPVDEQDAILKHWGTRGITNRAGFSLSWLPREPQLRLFTPADLAINIQRVDVGVAIHIIRYDYDVEKDQVPYLEELNLELRLLGNFGSVEVFAPDESPEAECETMAEDLYHLRLKNIPLYSIVLLKSISNNANEGGIHD
jgi:hypothetical protein